MKSVPNKRAARNYFATTSDLAIVKTLEAAEGVWHGIDKIVLTYSGDFDHDIVGSLLVTIGGVNAFNAPLHDSYGPGTGPQTSRSIVLDLDFNDEILAGGEGQEVEITSANGGTGVSGTLNVIYH